MISLHEQLMDARHTLEYRQKHYPKMVREGKMNQNDATRRIESMRAIMATLQKAYEMEKMAEEVMQGWPKGAE